MPSATTPAPQGKAFEFVDSFSVTGIPDGVFRNPLDCIRTGSGLYRHIGPSFYSALADEILSDVPDAVIEIHRSIHPLSPKSAQMRLRQQIYGEPVLDAHYFHCANVNMSNNGNLRAKTEGRPFAIWISAKQKELLVGQTPHWGQGGGANPDLIPEMGRKRFPKGTHFLVVKGQRPG